MTLTTRAAILLVALAAWSAPAAAATPAVGTRAAVDDFDDPAPWSAVPASGVTLAIRSDAGVHGRALRLDFDFHSGGGYAVVHRAVSLDLPRNYRFRFAVRGDCRPNDLEFKLIDSNGENVWWLNRRRFVFPAAWETLSTLKRQITFAWGPSDAPLAHVAAIEFAVTVGAGGKGTVWLDDLSLEALPEPPAIPPTPRATASSAARGRAAALAIDADSASYWASAPGDRRPWLALDLGGEREMGALVIDWAPGRRPANYDLEDSEDGVHWRTVRSVRGAGRDRAPFLFPDGEESRLRVRAAGEVGARGIAIRAITIEPPAWGETPAAFLQAIAKHARRGSYPRGMSGEQVYWSVVGADGDEEEALLSEDGALETGKGRFAIEPFLEIARPGAPPALATWADAAHDQRLDGLSLPLPSTSWTWRDLELVAGAFPIDSSLELPAELRPLIRAGAGIVARYRVTNHGGAPVRGALDLALRPFQVNPPTQFLNAPGGVAEIHDVARAGRAIRVGDRGVVSLTDPDGFGVAPFDAGDVVDDYLRAGRLPRATETHDPVGFASGALRYAFALAPGATTEVDLFVPLHGGVPEELAAPLEPTPVAAAERASRTGWLRRTAGVNLTLPGPGQEVARTLQAQIGWILVNRDGPAIQPGSRSYDRSWIRDGSLTSAALLRAGHTREARAFIPWFADHEYGDGKVPCCVDDRGADPVPEHDSSGELIFAVAEYTRLTGDLAFADSLWPHVARAAAYLDSLRHLRLGPEWRRPEQREFLGLLPPSISHEGYSAKPMHSYWDDLFALRGFKDAAWLAAALRKEPERRRWSAVRDGFARDLAASVRAAMARHRVDYVPGCADLGDFDATSTTIALDPVAAGAVLPDAAVRRTFERYWQFFTDRRDGKQPWDAYTPYEMRTIGAFVRLGWRDRANQLLDWFMKYRRPPGWAQWAEVVDHDLRHPRFIGDMPHTWVGSDFVRSVLDMFAYEREADSTLVLGAGVPLKWAMESPGVAVEGLVTPHGRVAYEMHAAFDQVSVYVAGGLRIPRGGILVLPPTPGPARRATVDGKPATLTREGGVIVRRLPATVVIRS